jgi:diadenosine tetraphosphate (Ap4A) HIT family hydrolase
VTLYNPDNARLPEQRAEMERLEAAGVCLFCELVRTPRGDGWFRTESWVASANEFPYRGARLHYLLAPTRHVVDLLELDDDVLADFWVALRRLSAEHDLRFYGLGARCGDCRYTGGTIAHVHVHVIVGDVDDPAHEPVRLKLSSRPAPDE